MTMWMEDILKKYRSTIDYMEVRQESIDRLVFDLSNNRLERLERKECTGYSVRVCHRGGWGFASFNTREKYERYVERAIAAAKRLGTSVTRLAEVKPVVDRVSLTLISDPACVELDQKIELFQSYIDKCRSFSSLIKNVKASYLERRRTIHFMNSDGTDVLMEKLDVAGAVTPFAVHHDQIQFVTVTDGSSNDYHVVTALGDKLEKACERSVQLTKADRVIGGTYTVILDPVLAGTFVHEAFGHMSEADDYYQNERMKDIFKIGRRFGPDELTIYDTGLDVGSRGYIVYDDEGVPSQRTVLIENGILCGRLHSRESAAFFNEKPTGNARTVGYRYPPICRMRNTCIAKGKADFDALLSGIKSGVYAIDTRGGTGGEMFSFDAGYGYMIRDGKLAELVRDVRLSGNLFKTLKKITSIGSDFRIVDDIGGCGKGEQFPLEVSCSSPHIKIEDVTIGGVNESS